MKTKYFHIIGYVVIAMVLLLLPTLASAQIDGIDDVPQSPDAPLDGGFSLLVAAGIGYGTKKFRQKSNKA